MRERCDVAPALPQEYRTLIYSWGAGGMYFDNATSYSLLEEVGRRFQYAQGRVPGGSLASCHEI